MYTGVLTLIVQGLRHPRVGGLGRVWNVAVDSGRTAELFRSDPRIDQCEVSSEVPWAAPVFFWDNHQPTSTPGNLIKLKPTPGLFGLYVSCIMSATLSTLSSGMNSMAAAIYEDFLKRKLDGEITDHQATFLNKAIVVSCGITSTALAFAAEPLGGILRVCVSVMGAISGPMVGIFVLAMFFPRSGFWSCIISFVVSNIIMIIICIANYVEDPYRDLFLPTNTSNAGCMSNNFTIRQPPLYDAHYGDPNTMFISR
ncbi:Sodium-dependent multivitamin transporter [Trichostrongylus colubriformis]|uniref:Sodium-dependent multivitamin transporter n=1 Tax=Trichostrongylus colubriformis TaxID=6319 RepID=A0AAN8G387_TRICO